MTHNRNKIRQDCLFSVDSAEWDKVGEAIENRVKGEKNNLFLTGKQILQMKKTSDGEVSVIKYEGDESTSGFCSELRLSKKMFDHHMPWGYSNLFDVMDLEAEQNLSVFDAI